MCSGSFEASAPYQAGRFRISRLSGLLAEWVQPSAGLVDPACSSRHFPCWMDSFCSARPGQVGGWPLRCVGRLRGLVPSFSGLVKVRSASSRCFVAGVPKSSSRAHSSPMCLLCRTPLGWLSDILRRSFPLVSLTFGGLAGLVVLCKHCQACLLNT